MAMEGRATRPARSSADAAMPSEVAAPSMRRFPLGAWLRTKANGLSRARMVVSVGAVASMSTGLGRAGIRHRSAQRIAAAVIALTPAAVSMIVRLTPLRSRVCNRRSSSPTLVMASTTGSALGRRRCQLAMVRCRSASIMRTTWPSCIAATASPMASVLLPLSPFCVARTIVCMMPSFTGPHRPADAEPDPALTYRVDPELVYARGASESPMPQPWPDTGRESCTVQIPTAVEMRGSDVHRAGAESHRTVCKCTGRSTQRNFQLRAAHLRHVDELPRVRQVAARHLDHRRLVSRERLLQRLAQGLRAGRPIAADGKTVGQPHEVRVGQVGADHPVAVVVPLHVADIAEGAVVEQDHDDRDAVAHRGRELLHVEHEAAVAAERDDRRGAERVLGAERDGDAPAERALVTRGDEGARRAYLVENARGIADLRQLVDQHAVVGQDVTDRLEIAEDDAELFEIGGNALLERPARGDAHRVHRRKMPEVLVEPPQHRGRVPRDAGHRRRHARELGGIDVDLDDREPVVDAPGGEW